MLYIGLKGLIHQPAVHLKTTALQAGPDHKSLCNQVDDWRSDISNYYMPDNLTSFLLICPQGWHSANACCLFESSYISETAWPWKSVGCYLAIFTPVCWLFVSNYIPDKSWPWKAVWCYLTILYLFLLIWHQNYHLVDSCSFTPVCCLFISNYILDRSWPWKFFWYYLTILHLFYWPDLHNYIPDRSWPWESVWSIW